MFKLIAFELQKVWCKKVFISLLTTLFLLNLFLLWYTNQSSDEAIPLSAYSSYHRDISHLPNEKRMPFIKEYYDEVKGLEIIETIKLYESWQTKQGSAMANSLKENNQDTYVKYLPLWQSKDSLKYTNTIQQEIQFAQEIYEEANKVNHYEDTLNDIEEAGNTLHDISIFSSNPSNHFSIQNILKTSADYEKMSGTYITYDISKGVISATSSYYSDILLCIFLFAFASMLIHEEKEKHLFNLTKITPLGKYESITAKIISLWINTGVVTIILYGTNYLFFQMNVGFGDLDRTIQSIGAFMGSTLPLSVGTYLFLFFLIKWFVCFTIGLLVLLLSIKCKHSTISYFLCALILIGSYALFLLVPDNTKYTFFKYINLFALFQVQTIFTMYLNLNIAGHAISLLVVSIMFMITLLITFWILSVYIFNTSHTLISTKHTLGKWQNGIVILPYRASASLIKHEAYKIFIMNKSFILCIVFAALMINQYRSTSTYITPEETYYKTYMASLQGKLTDEKITYLNLEKEKFNDIHAKLTEIESLKEEQHLSTMQVEAMSSPYVAQLGAEQSFERIWQRYTYLQTQPGAEFVYDSGYLLLFDINGLKSSNNSLLSMCILMILCCYRICSIEYATGAQSLLSTTPKGKECILHRKLSIGILLSIGICLFDATLHVITICNTYGMSSLHASITSIPAYASLPSNISILAFLIILIIYKLLTCATFIFIIFASSHILKNNLYALLASALFIIVPILFVMMSLQWCSYVSFIPLFNAGYYIANAQGFMVLAYIIIAILLSFISYYILRHRL